MLNISHEPSTLRKLALRAADSIYSLCFYSVAGFTLALILAGVVSIAVASSVVEVPEFHSR